jgi:hypothetical protein
MALAYLICSTPFLLVPVIVGILILRKYPRDQVAQATALFTMKPVVSTLLASIILATPPLAQADSNTLEPFYFLTIIPSLCLTLVLAIIYRSLLTRSRTLTVLLILDVARWLVTILLHPLWPVRPGFIALCDAMIQAVPTAYAFAALHLLDKSVTDQATRTGQSAGNV